MKKPDGSPGPETFQSFLRSWSIARSEKTGALLSQDELDLLVKVGALVIFWSDVDPNPHNADDAEVLRDVLREEVERGGLDLTRDRRRLVRTLDAVADLAALQSLALPRGRDAPCFRLVGVDDLLEHHAEKLRRPTIDAM